MLLSACKNWILSNKCHEDLESFIGELAKRTLKWPKYFSNTAALVTLHLHSAKSYLLQKQFTFVEATELRFNRIGVVAMKSLSDDPKSLCLVKECRELESHFDTVFTTEILIDADSTDPTKIKKDDQND